MSEPHTPGQGMSLGAIQVDATALLDAAPDAVIAVDRSSTIVLVNIQAERLFGYPREALIGEKLECLIPTAVRAAHVGYVARYLEHPVTRPMGSYMALTARRRDGSEVEVEVSLSPVRAPEGLLVCAAVRDVSARRRMEEAVQLNADRLASAVESIEDALALYDARDHLVLCNSAYRMLVGAPATGSVVGLTFEAMLDAWLPSLAFEDDADRARHRADRLALRQERRAALDVRSQDGRRFRVTTRRTVEGGVVETIWDLTDDLRLAEDLREARAAAESASAAKSEFLSAMSHELRTPLNAILGFAQLLFRDKRTPPSDRQRERIEHILKGGQHLLHLIDEVLDLSRIETGRVPISLEPVEVAGVLSEVEATLGPMAERHGITLVMEALPADLAPVVADRVRFKQVLLNFGSNAIKYGRSGGHTMVAVQPRGDQVRVVVRDDGAGIPQEKQERVFEPFYRAGQELGSIEGTGIGLTLSKRLAELMAGQVGFWSQHGVGSEFWVDLPVHRESLLPLRTAVPAHSLESALSDSHQGRRHLILYVEDNPSNIAFMEDLMGDFEGVELITAPTAEIGIELARARQPQVVIMDINLPGMSGLQAVRHLKAWDETRAIPVIALSAAATERDASRAMEIGFHDYLTKPVDVGKLTRVLEALLA